MLFNQKSVPLLNLSGRISINWNLLRPLYRNPLLFVIYADIKQGLNYWLAVSSWYSQGFESRWMSVELIRYVKTIIVFYKIYDFFCRRHSLMNQPCHNNLFLFMQYDNLRNLNRVIFTHLKHLETRVSAFWYCFPVIKRYTFHNSRKSAPIQGKESSFDIFQLFDIWRYQSLVILFFSSILILI